MWMFFHDLQVILITVCNNFWKVLIPVNCRQSSFAHCICLFNRLIHIHMREQGWYTREGAGLIHEGGSRADTRTVLHMKAFNWWPSLRHWCTVSVWKVHLLLIWKNLVFQFFDFHLAILGLLMNFYPLNSKENNICVYLLLHSSRKTKRNEVLLFRWVLQQFYQFSFYCSTTCYHLHSLRYH